MMQHNEQVGAEQNCVFPLSPILQIRRVPCQRRFSFPADRPALTNCPRVSTAALDSRVEPQEFYCLSHDQRKDFTYKRHS